MDTWLYSKEQYAREHHYDILLDYLRDKYNAAMEMAAKTGNAKTLMNF